MSVKKKVYGKKKLPHNLKKFNSKLLDIFLEISLFTQQNVLPLTYRTRFNYKTWQLLNSLALQHDLKQVLQFIYFLLRENSRKILEGRQLKRDYPNVRKEKIAEVVYPLNKLLFVIDPDVVDFFKPACGSQLIVTNPIEALQCLRIVQQKHYRYKRDLQNFNKQKNSNGSIQAPLPPEFKIQGLIFIGWVNFQSPNVYTQLNIPVFNLNLNKQTTYLGDYNLTHSPDFQSVNLLLKILLKKLFYTQKKYKSNVATPLMGQIA